MKEHLKQASSQFEKSTSSEFANKRLEEINMLQQLLKRFDRGSVPRFRPFSPNVRQFCSKIRTYQMSVPKEIGHLFLLPNNA
ncbi:MULTISPECIES: hypothetical protein [Geobacillus]|uniref:hypothetical protein n=1 Tax=Geobacillus TaxID=129337 RepID=UPI000FE1410E|nr:MULTISPECIES: hypothetical protein [Geobacillus]WJQ00937.1 hypothetical protein QT234_03475 [Geobacillus stearothermophilus]MED3668345.1 hypothetical protein [Geobacillus kaustophilus]NNU98950.1 hypothetical protein [Geobacillus sp. DSP4a]TLS32257.1 hypothetical protein FDK15_14410 [Geobacillus thermoleovorans]WJQ04346.1 hypothetical protein QT236_03425 [Geobacillus stearothermophilus]